MTSLYWMSLRVAAVVSVGVLAATTAFAGPPPSGAACVLGKGGPGNGGLAKIDLNDNRMFDGTAAGDANFGLASFDSGPGSVFVSGDWAGAGSPQVARYTDSTATYVDLNGNYAWNGNAGGDLVFFFAPGQGQQQAVIGDWNMDAADEWGTYNNSTRAFRLDKNGNGAFDGVPTDANFAIAANQGDGIGVAGDWNGTGRDCAARLIAPNNNWVIDLNCNDAWNGNAGGDHNGFFAPGQSNSLPLVGDWDGDGDDDIGVYNPNNDQFFLDLNDNLTWDGNAGGDKNIVIAFADGAGQPVVCDWNGDGSDNVGKLIGTSAQFTTDLNGNNQWDGNAGGDFNGFFGPGSGSGLDLSGAFQPAGS